MLRLNFHAKLFEISTGQTFFSPASGPPIEEPCLKGTVLNMLPIVIKGIVHPKIKILSLFTHRHVVPNMC